MRELVSFITCGFPDKEFTKELGAVLLEAGSDRLELGIAFSDPVADGVLIEKASLAAIRAGFKVSDAFEIASALTPALLYFMGYFNSFFSGGFGSFCAKASSCGVRGLIIPDLPFEESLRYAGAMEENGLFNISFLAVTHADERIEKIAAASKDFIYLVAFAGITGADKEEDLAPILQKVKSVTDTKVFVGFGVNEKTAKKRCEGADGVIVGSAFTKILFEDTLSKSEKLARCASLAKTIKAQINE
ncbi:MAG TPA: tryptophan synthase subunit alpha [Campylobacterales bacterium]|nr:tryptophan synthase subunit alpha [Campylobacterales bacterium]